jgi:hypothetical protein
LVEQEEPEQAEKLFRYSVRRNGLLRDIEKLVGLNLPKETSVSSQILMLPKNQSNKDKEDNNAIQLRKPKQTLQTEAATTVLVQDVRVKIMTDALIDN